MLEHVLIGKVPTLCRNMLYSTRRECSLTYHISVLFWRGGALAAGEKIMRSAMTLMLLALACATPAYAAPNFVVIMTDDQDDTGSIDTMPGVQKLAQEGITFTNSFVNFSLCAPSRATFLSGQAAHNHGILQNEDAYSTFAPREANALGVWLQQAGYATALIGKVINHYGDVDPTHVMPGWSQWHVIGDAGYFNYSINDNGILRVHGNAAEDYQTDVLAQKAVDLSNIGPQGHFSC